MDYLPEEISNEILAIFYGYEWKIAKKKIIEILYKHARSDIEGYSQLVDFKVRKYRDKLFIEIVCDSDSVINMINSKVKFVINKE